MPLSTPSHCWQVDAIVFLVDAHDRERFPEAKKELDGLLSSEDLACAAGPQSSATDRLAVEAS